MSQKPQTKKACPTKLFRRGFTLLEILLVVGIIAILAGIVIIAINPNKQLATVRNTQRLSDIKQIYNAMSQYYIDHNAYPASSTPTSFTEICDTGTASYPSGVDCTGLADLSALVPTYMVAIPRDPQGSTLSLVPKAYATTNGTGYKIMIDPNSKVMLTAPEAELNINIAIGTTTAALLPIPTSGLISYWSLNGNANDNWGSNNGTASGATLTTGVKNLPNTAYAFNGINNYIIIPFSQQPGAISASVWFKTSTTTGGAIFNYDTGDGQVFAIYANQLTYGPGSVNKLDYSFYNGSWHNYSSATSVNNGAWHNAIITNDGTNLNMWIDGTKEVDNAASAAIPYNYSANPRNQLSVGLYGPLNERTNPFNGSIDNVRLYNRVLTAGEVQAIYVNERP